MTVDRQFLIDDAMRLENAEPDLRKNLWLLSFTSGQDECLVIVEAVTAVGAVGVAETLDLRTGGDVQIAGPFPRDLWPISLWYRPLTEDDVALVEQQRQVEAD